METRRLFPDFQPPVEGERLEELLTRKGVRIERILSAPGSMSGPYDQEQDEWVLLLQGRAVLEVAGARIELAAGETLFLPAHTVHSVLDTSADPPCIWLAVHIGR
jgi:cupin 2 domain-containing protein